MSDWCKEHHGKVRDGFMVMISTSADLYFLFRVSRCVCVCQSHDAMLFGLFSQGWRRQCGTARSHSSRLSMSSCPSSDSTLHQASVLWQVTHRHTVFIFITNNLRKGKKVFWHIYFYAVLTGQVLICVCSQETRCMLIRGFWTSTCPSSCIISTIESLMWARSRSSAGVCMCERKRESGNDQCCFSTLVTWFPHMLMHKPWIPQECLSWAENNNNAIYLDIHSCHKRCLCGSLNLCWILQCF